jgi:RNA 2',3'-cyclic 3'-phosphodiesterase
VRLFVALEIPAPVRDNLAAQIKELRDWPAALAYERLRWVCPENLHVTLKFIGEVEAAKLDGIRSALTAIGLDAPVDLHLRGLGFFPDEKYPRVLCVGLHASGNLPVLAREIDRALEGPGIARDERAFTPHLTLARFASRGLHEKLRTAVQKNSEREFGAFQAREFRLIQSKLKPSGADYTTLASFPLALEA